MDVRRESAPPRMEAEMSILERAADGYGGQGSVNLESYDRKAASDRSRHGGGLLDLPIVKIR